MLPPCRQVPTAALVLSPSGLKDCLQLVDVSDENLVEERVAPNRLTALEGFS